MTSPEIIALGTQLSCQQIIEFLADYLSGELAESQQAIFEAHLAICDDCKHYLESYQQTVQLLSAPPEKSLEPLPEDLVRAILAAQETTKFPPAQ